MTEIKRPDTTAEIRPPLTETHRHTPAQLAAARHLHQNLAPGEKRGEIHTTAGKPAA